MKRARLWQQVTHESRICMLAIAILLPCLGWAQSGSPSSTKESEETRLKMPQIVEALGLHQGSKVADIGAGDGTYEPSLSRAVADQGRVYAEDIDEGTLKRLRDRIAKDHLGNIEVVLGTADDPKLPPDALDAVLMVIMYHEIANPQNMLKLVSAALKPGGRLVIVDMPPRKTATRPRADQTKNHMIAADLVTSEVVAAGFEIVSRDDHFVDPPDEEMTRWMIVFRKPVGR